MFSRSSFPKIIFLFLLPGFILLSAISSFAQTIRYQNGVRGGFTVASNALNLSSQTVFVNNAGGTQMSSYSDLVLPSGSTIVKAFLYAEGYATLTLTSVKFKVPGAPGYTTLTPASTGFIANPATGSYTQFIIDVTSYMPASGGYVSTVTAGGSPATTGRYSVADLLPYDSGNYGYGWALFVIYSNPSAKFRNVTIVDACKNFGIGTSTTFDVNNISVPSSGTVNAVVAATGCWGDAGAVTYGDDIKFGKKGGTLTALADPTTGATNDVLNSTIGFAVPNNVTIDGLTGMANGNYVARKPYNTFGTAAPPTATSFYYDCDIMNASGILLPSAVPISATIKQTGNGSDALGTGAYAVSIDIASANVSKTLSPTSIADGGTATYTFTVSNLVPGGINLTGIGFKDNLPSGIIVANPANITITGGSGGTVTALPGSNSITLSGLNLNMNQLATITVDVTNVPGQSNADCSTNPAAFTNGFTNIVNNTANLANAVSPQCLLVSATVPVKLLNFGARIKNNSIALNWVTVEEINAKEFIVERIANDRFIEIGRINAHGTTSQVHEYSFIDPSPINGTNYYRLRQLDFNGEYEYSRTVSANLPTAISNVKAVNIYGGTSLELSFSSLTENYSTVKLFDITGRLVRSIPFNVKEGNNTQLIDISGLDTGIFILNITSDSGYSENIKFRK